MRLARSALGKDKIIFCVGVDARQAHDDPILSLFQLDILYVHIFRRPSVTSLTLSDLLTVDPMPSV